MEESLRRHGFGDKGIEAVFKYEDEISRPSTVKPAVQEPLDFGDWD